MVFGLLLSSDHDLLSHPSIMLALLLFPIAVRIGIAGLILSLQVPGSASGQGYSTPATEARLYELWAAHQTERSNDIRVMISSKFASC